MLRRYFLLLVIVLCAAAWAENAGKPNFSGRWKMDTEKSDFGPTAAPSSAEYAIRQTGAMLLLQYTENGHSSRVDIIPDGQERVTETSADTQTLTRAYWTGTTLVIEARLRPLPSASILPLQWTSRWTLSQEGKVLTIRRRITQQGKSIEQMVVFNRQ